MEGESHRMEQAERDFWWAQERAAPIVHPPDQYLVADLKDALDHLVSDLERPVPRTGDIHQHYHIDNSEPDKRREPPRRLPDDDEPLELIEETIDLETNPEGVIDFSELGILEIPDTGILEVVTDVVEQTTEDIL